MMWLASIGHNPDRLTDRAIKVLRVARDRAATCCHPRVTPEHVLWALATVEHGPGRVTLERLGVDLARNLAELETLPELAHAGTEVKPVPSQEVEQLLRQAKVEAQSLGHNYVGTEHIVLGLLSCEPCPAVDYLRVRGVSLENVRKEALRVLSGD
jgi:ATP-dependent Clp protease ATP-binding subunit ClpC